MCKSLVSAAVNPGSRSHMVDWRSCGVVAHCSHYAGGAPCTAAAYPSLTHDRWDVLLSRCRARGKV